jgi:hypothetical protein
VTRALRIQLAKKRILSVVNTHGIATARTIEHKIADGGPYNQRIDPHLITVAKNELIHFGELKSLEVAKTTWYYNTSIDAEYMQFRLSEQLPTYLDITKHLFTKRVGQVLEITVMRALERAHKVEYFGRFTDLTEHDDKTLYRKEEPPSHIGKRQLPGKQKLDFIVRTTSDSSHWAGLEVKNTRPWVYPRQDEVMELLRKCSALDIVPVLIARRIPYVTRHLFTRCGLVTWQTLRQRYPETDTELAVRARNKRLLGYADITLGTDPDGPLVNFVCENLPQLIPEARERLNSFKDLLNPFAFGEMSYDEFAARVRRRSEGRSEDFDFPNDDWLEPPW